MMGFITKGVVQRRRNYVQGLDVAELAEADAREQARRAQETELETAIREFCSPDSLGAIRHIVHEMAVEKYIRTEYVGWVTVYWDFPDLLINDEACAAKLLAHLRELEPQVHEVKLTKTAYHKFIGGKTAIIVYFKNGLRPS